MASNEPMQLGDVLAQTSALNIGVIDYGIDGEDSAAYDCFYGRGCDEVWLELSASRKTGKIETRDSRWCLRFDICSCCTKVNYWTACFYEDEDTTVHRMIGADAVRSLREGLRLAQAFELERTTGLTTQSVKGFG